MLIVPLAGVARPGAVPLRGAVMVTMREGVSHHEAIPMAQFKVAALAAVWHSLGLTWPDQLIPMLTFEPLSLGADHSLKPSGASAQLAISIALSLGAAIPHAPEQSIWATGALRSDGSLEEHLNGVAAKFMAFLDWTERHDPPHARHLFICPSDKADDLDAAQLAWVQENPNLRASPAAMHRAFVGIGTIPPLHPGRNIWLLHPAREDVKTLLRHIPALFGDARAPAADLDLPSHIKGYRVGALLEETAVARTYRAHHPSEHPALDVMLKVLHQPLIQDHQAMRRLQREAILLSQLSHPNIQAYRDVDFVEGRRAVLILEHLSGQDFSTYVSRRREQNISPPDHDEILGWMLALCDAMALVHRRGVVHRDVTLRNMFLCHDGVLKVMGFGLAFGEFSNTLGQTTLSWRGQHGVHAYSSPELLRDAAPSAASDVYALGLMLAELYCGHHPLLQPEESPEGVSVGRWAMLHCVEAPRLLHAHLREARVSPAVRAIILRATHADLTTRYADASALLLAIQALERDAAQPSRTAVFSSWRRPRAPHLALIVAAALLLGGVIMAGVIWRMTSVSSSSSGAKHYTRATLDALSSTLSPYALDAQPVTFVDYERCQREGVCLDVSTLCTAYKDVSAVTCVNWLQATTFCAWRGARLPAAREWRLAVTLHPELVRSQPQQFASFYEWTQDMVHAGAEERAQAVSATPAPRLLSLDAALPELGFRCAQRLDER